MNLFARRPGLALALLGVLSLGAVGAALVSQHVFGMQPCPWCVLQRLIFAVIGLVCLAGAALAPGVAAAAAGLVALVLAGLGSASALYQHFVAAQSSSCNLTLADRIVSGTQLDVWLPEIFEVRASCADAAVNLLGVPYEFWSLALFTLIELALVMAWLGLRRKA
jgi:disulfide bond formation protein DsbB